MKKKRFNLLFILFVMTGLLGIKIAFAGPMKHAESRFPDGKVRDRYTYYLDEKNHEVRSGLAEEFFQNGNKKGEVNWVDGKEDGLVVYYFADARKSYETNYKEGKKNGYATVWYPNGQKQWQTVFREGLTHGVWREWHPDGKKKFEANYSNGKLEGLATWWHENGRIWQERSYLNGDLVKGSVHEWDKTGKQTYPPLSSGETGSSGSSSGESISNSNSTTNTNLIPNGNVVGSVFPSDSNKSDSLALKSTQKQNPSANPSKGPKSQ